MDRSFPWYTLAVKAFDDTVLEVILKSDIEIKGLATIQKAEANKVMSSLILDLEDKVAARVSDALDTALVLLIGTHCKEFPCSPILESNETLFALGNDPKSSSPEGFLYIAPILRFVSTTRLERRDLVDCSTV